MTLASLVLFAAAAAGELAPARAQPGPPPELPSDFTAEEHAAFAAEVGKLELPNASFTLVVRKSQPGGLPSTSEQKVWWSKKNGRVHAAGNAPELFIDLAQRALVVVDHDRKEAVRFPFEGRPGEHMAREALGPMLGLAGMEKKGEGTAAGKRCEVYEGERVVRTPLGPKVKSKERRCMWKGLALSMRSEREAMKVPHGGGEMVVPPLVIEAEVKDLVLGKVKPADLEPPRGMEIQAAEKMMIKPPTKEELEKGPHRLPPPRGKKPPPPGEE